jgi:hypothetical protein
MPNRILSIAFAATALSLAACGGAFNNPSDLFGTAVPSASPTPVTTPNAKVSAALVIVTVSSSPLPNQPVMLFTDTNGHTGTLISTQETDASGQTLFTGLTPAMNYCFTTSFTPTTPGSLTQDPTTCTNLWFLGVEFPLSS